MTEPKTKIKQRYYLHLIRVANLAISEISQVLLIVANKRQTLAEKGITSELSECAFWEGRLIAILAQLLKEENYFSLSTDGKILRLINTRLVEKLQAFSKAANYNLNYLEQYFEHDFWLALTGDQNAQRLSEVVSALEEKIILRSTKGS